ncbi:uncharacterized protein A4U43_C04F32760 [Asparagus officinalis]|uniref:Expansin-like EG45 domain-containing protein n=1 Tax=Asparagus officinalis TaxID=4686 RepID=A0A5P1F824_ASPOF|nr:uncharacterized protein A4U43_C04F32760 [Asparagus officinalis]
MLVFTRRQPGEDGRRPEPRGMELPMEPEVMVRCTRDHACSKKPVTVVITDECPRGPCLVESVHFDLNGTAIGAMALPRRADRLRGVGVLPIQYTRVPCKFPHKTIAFHVACQASNRNYFGSSSSRPDGEGSLSNVELGESRSVNKATWRPMIQSWGALWKLDSGPKLRAPFSIRLTSQHSKKKVVAKNVVPARWRPGATYRSLVNFH